MMMMQRAMFPLVWLLLLLVFHQLSSAALTQTAAALTSSIQDEQSSSLVTLHQLSRSLHFEAQWAPSMLYDALNEEELLGLPEVS